MKVPETHKRKALFVIDVQPVFMKEHVLPIVPRIVSLIEQVPYDFYVETLFHAEKGSLWDLQQNWTCPQDEHTMTVPEVSQVLAPHSPLKILKETKSPFTVDPRLLSELKNRGIEEIHMVGVDTNDCLIATAFEAFDLGFLAYVLEECSSADTSPEAHELGLQILRLQKSTNNSCLEKVVDINV